MPWYYHIRWARSPVAGSRMRRPIRYSAIGAVLLAAAAAGWAWLGERPMATQPELSHPADAPPSRTTVPPADNAAAAAAALPTAAKAAPAAAASFDVVRVGPEGRAVIAGRALPD